MLFKQQKRLKIISILYRYLHYLYINYLLMRKILSGLARLTKSFDQFSTTQFLHYRGSDSYNTFTGGLFSLIIIGAIITLGIKQFISMVNKDTITSTTFVQFEANPSNLNVTFSAGAPLMFSISISNFFSGISLRDHFDVYAQLIVKEPSFAEPYMQYYKLQNCTREHFAFSSSTQQAFNAYKLADTGYCPPLNKTMILGGRLATFKLYTLSVESCVGQSRCVDQKTFHSTLTNGDDVPTVTILYINTVVNPGAINYKSVYVEDRNYFFISETMRPFAMAQVAETVINFDQQFWPVQKQTSETIVSIPQLFRHKEIPTQYSTNIYAFIAFEKSTQKTIHTQNVTKIDAIISYVGGLIGSIISAFFLMRTYSESSFLINIAQYVFSYDHHSEIDSKKFNFWEYIKMVAKGILEKCGGGKDWRLTEMFQWSQAEMGEQLNVELILEKLTYFEAAIASLFTGEQLQALFLVERRSLNDAANARKRFQASNRYFLQQSIPSEDNRGGQKECNTSHGKNKQTQGPPFQVKANEIELKDSIVNPNACPPSQKCLNVDGSQERVRRGHEDEDKHQQQAQQAPEPSEHSQIEQKRERLTFLAQMKANLLQVIGDAGKGDRVSLRIARRLCNKAVQEMGLKEHMEQLEMMSVLEDASVLHPNQPQL